MFANVKLLKNFVCVNLGLLLLRMLQRFLAVVADSRTLRRVILFLYVAVWTPLLLTLDINVLLIENISRLRRPWSFRIAWLLGGLEAICFCRLLGGMMMIFDVNSSYPSEIYKLEFHFQISLRLSIFPLIANIVQLVWILLLATSLLFIRLILFFLSFPILSMWLISIMVGLIIAICA